MSFALSKILWLIFSPFNLIILLLLVGLVSKIFKITNFSNYFLFTSFLLFLICGILPTGSYLGYVLEKNFHQSLLVPDDLTGVLILSGSINPYLTKEYKQVSLNASSERLFESYKIIKEKKIAIIYSGGPADIGNSNLNVSNGAKQFFFEMTT